MKIQSTVSLSFITVTLSSLVACSGSSEGVSDETGAAENIDASAMYVTSGPPRNGFTFCSKEHDRCAFTGEARIAYGAGDKFVYLRATDGIDCNNDVFGDPNVGVFKGCFIKPNVGSSQAGRPRVFMAVHGSNDLANKSGLDSQWAYVRNHLDGIWGNSAKVTPEEEAALWRKVKTRTLVSEFSLSGFPVAKATPAECDKAYRDGAHLAMDQDFGLRLEREAISLYTSVPAKWDQHTIADAYSSFVNGPAQPFSAVYTGWGFENLRLPNDAYYETQDDPRANPRAAIAMDQADGTFVECVKNIAVSLHGETLIQGVRRAHAHGRPFVLFASGTYDSPPGTKPSGWLHDFQATYDVLANSGDWHSNDIVMIINYQGSYPITPEATASGEAADTATGLAYWAIRQREAWTRQHP